MKILKKWSKTKECNRCGCLLEYGIEDIKSTLEEFYSNEREWEMGEIGMDELRVSHRIETSYIYCPFCQQKVVINKIVIPCKKENKEETNVVEEENKKMMNNLLNGKFGKIENGMCRLSMSGGIAVKTSNGYKSYNVKTGRLTNCNNFVFNVGEEFFFVIPTNKVSKGDIILVNGKPRCVIEAEKNKITVINYEDSTIDTILPERHVFMGNTYFYGKIVSMFGNEAIKGKKGTNNIVKYMMLSQMMGGNSDSSTGMMNGNGMNSMLPLMMMGGNVGDVFDGMFDFDMSDDVEDDEDTEEEE